MIRPGVGFSLADILQDRSVDLPRTGVLQRAIVTAFRGYVYRLSGGGWIGASRRDGTK